MTTSSRALEHQVGPSSGRASRARTLLVGALAVAVAAAVVGASGLGVPVSGVSSMAWRVLWYASDR